MNTKLSQALNKRLEAEVFNNLNQGQDFGLQIGVLKKGKLVYRKTFGQNYKFFDLASLTKTIVTAGYFAKKPDLRKKKVSDVLPWLGESKVKISDLLNHSAGLKAHIKFFNDLKSLPEDEKRTGLQKFLRDEFLKAKAKSTPLYSDLDFLILGFVIEETEGCRLEHYFERENSIGDLHYNKVPFKGVRSDYAPTEKCPWRKKDLRGEVLDGNTYFMGGVAPHAGLFGSLNSVLDYGKSIRKQYQKAPHLFKAQNKEWAYGFMIPSGPSSSAGKYFSKKSIGHLGFTGTSFWYDPEADLFVVVLANRTYPDRSNSKFNTYRPVIHNVIYEETI